MNSDKLLTIFDELAHFVLVAFVAVVLFTVDLSSFQSALLLIGLFIQVDVHSIKCEVDD